MKTRVRAVIIQGSRVLLINRKKPSKEYWVFPGGGLEDTDATPELGLARECLEELGVVVQVGRQLAEVPLGADQVELFFLCTITSGTIGTGQGPEATRDPSISGSYKPEWVAIPVNPDMDLQPVIIRDMLPALAL